MKIKESINSPTGLPEVVGNNGRRVATAVPQALEVNCSIEGSTHEEKYAFDRLRSGEEAGERIDEGTEGIQATYGILDEALNNSQLLLEGQPT